VTINKKIKKTTSISESWIFCLKEKLKVSDEKCRFLVKKDEPASEIRRQHALTFLYKKNKSIS
jgi:hypothetical protein